jgi:uncharacterized protein YqjF (DUF2071 family)
MHIQITMRDMLFVNYAIQPGRLRPLVPEQFELDTRDSLAFISLVAFRNEEIKAGVLPLPEYNQINYRAYISHGEEKAVYFFDMNVNSRVIATGTNFLGLPVDYEEIEIRTREEKTEDEKSPKTILSVRSSGKQGLAVEAEARSDNVVDGVTAEFFTERPIGYVKAPAGGILKVTVEHEKIEVIHAKVRSARALFFESLGLLSEEESNHPYSVFYARESLFNTSPPALMLV